MAQLWALLNSGHAQLVHAVASLKVLPYFLIQPVDQMLPWLELVLGICFVLGVFPRIVAAIGLPLFSAFIVINVFNLQNGLANPCSSCFGNLMVLRSRDALVIDVFLVLAALRTISMKEHFVSLEGLWTRKRHPA